jgi:hypothetical protein
MAGHKEKELHYDAALRSIIGNLSYSQFVNLPWAYNSTEIIDTSVSSRLVLAQPAFSSFRYSIVTSYVHEILADSLLERGLGNFFIFLRSEPDKWLWEGYCHSKIPTMSRLDVTRIDLYSKTGQVENVSFEGMPQNVIYAKDSMLLTASEQVGYYRRAVPSPDLTTCKFDAYSITEHGETIIFQYTDPYSYQYVTNRSLYEIFVELEKNRGQGSGGNQDTEKKMWHHVVVISNVENKGLMDLVHSVVRWEDMPGRQRHSGRTECSTDPEWRSHIRQYVLGLKTEKPTGTK